MEMDSNSHRAAYSMSVTHSLRLVSRKMSYHVMFCNYMGARHWSVPRTIPIMVRALPLRGQRPARRFCSISRRPDAIYKNQTSLPRTTTHFPAPFLPRPISRAQIHWSGKLECRFIGFSATRAPLMTLALRSRQLEFLQPCCYGFHPLVRSATCFHFSSSLALFSFFHNLYALPLSLTAERGAGEGWESSHQLLSLEQVSGISEKWERE